MHCRSSQGPLCRSWHQPDVAVRSEIYRGSNQHPGNVHPRFCFKTPSEIMPIATTNGRICYRPPIGIIAIHQHQCQH